MRLKDTVNITVVDSHFITIYSGNPQDMVRYFTEEERTLDEHENEYKKDFSLFFKHES